MVGEPVEYLIYLTRMKVDVAREAKRMDWEDLYNYSIKTADDLIAEMEERYETNFRRTE